MLEKVREAGGKSVLAHPRVYDSFELLDELVLSKSIDGVEVWHPKNTAADVQRLHDIVKINNLIATGGTDFHGLYGSRAIRVGEYFTPHIYIEKILS